MTKSVQTCFKAQNISEKKFFFVVGGLTNYTLHTYAQSVPHREHSPSPLNYQPVHAVLESIHYFCQTHTTHTIALSLKEIEFIYVKSSGTYCYNRVLSGYMKEHQLAASSVVNRKEPIKDSDRDA